MIDPRPDVVWKISTPGDYFWCRDTYDKERRLQLNYELSGDHSKAREHRLNARNLMNKLIEYHTRPVK